MSPRISLSEEQRLVYCSSSDSTGINILLLLLFFLKHLVEVCVRMQLRVLRRKNGICGGLDQGDSELPSSLYPSMKYVFVQQCKMHCTVIPSCLLPQALILYDTGF